MGSRRAGRNRDHRARRAARHLPRQAGRAQRVTVAAEPAVAALQSRIRDAAQAQRAVRIRGGGSKDFYGRRVDGDVVDTRDIAGIVDYEPTELVITVRGGTPLEEVDTALTSANQMLA